MALSDILSSELTESQIRIVVQNVFDQSKGEDLSRTELLARSKTVGNAKSLLEFYELVRQAIDNYETRAGISENKKILLTEEEPNLQAQTETITLSLMKREPGAFQQGAPLEANIKNLRPRLREEKEDEEHPGYKLAIHGYWHSNVVRFTCWATTNKAANLRAEWFENLMEEYSWWFKIQGVDRVLFLKREADIVFDSSGKKWYGRPIDYFVRTERIRVLSEKVIEEIIIELITKKSLI